MDKEQKYYLKLNKVYAGKYNYLNYDFVQHFIELDSCVQDLFCKGSVITQFTKPEIQWLIDEFGEDVKDFNIELVKPEEIVKDFEKRILEYFEVEKAEEQI